MIEIIPAIILGILYLSAPNSQEKSGPDLTDGDYLLVFAIKPDPPLHGCSSIPDVVSITVMFDITKFGAPENIRIISSNVAYGPGMFGRQAAKTIHKYRYKPYAVDGEMHRRTDVTKTIEFDCGE